MDGVSMDHYEKQLYTVFKTFDVDNREALNRNSVLDLCDALQLGEKSSTLLETLFEKPEDRVTFTQFRNGLLSVLGGGDAPATQVPPSTQSDDDSSGREVAPKFVYGSKKYGRRSKPQTVASPSSYDIVDAREPCLNSPRTLMSNCRVEFENKKQKSLLKSKSVPESSDTISEKRYYDANTPSRASELDHNRQIDYEEAIKLCKNLHMASIDVQIIRHIFEDNASIDKSNKITVGEFFHRLNNSLTISIASGCQSDSMLSNDNVLNESLEVGTYNGSVEAKVVLEAWEQAGIEQGLQLLHELGFTTTSLHITDLSNALDEELRVLSVQHNTPSADARALLLQASLALHRFQFIKIKNVMEQVFIENNKLKNDLSDANRRAQILAQEVDENYARMEISLKSKIKQIEMKHVEHMKNLTTEFNIDKEKSLATIAQLEEVNMKYGTEETRLKNENALLLQKNEEMKKNLLAGKEKISELETVRVQLTKEMKVLSEKSNVIKEECEEQHVLKELALRLDDLQLENKMLRDRNDELCAEVDSLTSNASKDDQRLHLLQTTPMSTEKVTTWRDESEAFESGERPGKRRGDSPGLARLSDDESPRVGKLRKKLSNKKESNAAGLDADNSEGPNSLTSIHITPRSQEFESSLIGLDQRFISHMEIMRRLQEILDSSQNIPSADVSICESCNNLNDIIAKIQDQIKDMTSCMIYSEHSMKMDSSEVSVQTELDNEIDLLKGKLTENENLHKEEKLKLDNIIKELESSLEQMKIEYDKCEEYWTKKLEEEKELHYEEQRLSDERLNELISKITEYEEQFAPKNNSIGLPTIDEKYSLEMQFTDLEEEFNTFKKEKEKELRIKNEEIEQAKEKLKALEQKIVTNGNKSPNDWYKTHDSPPTSPIGYLWSQGTINSPYVKPIEKKSSVRDYQNPAFANSSQNKCEENVRCSSDSEKEKGVLKPIERPDLPQRSSSVGALRDERLDKDKQPPMIHCSELEGHLRRQQFQSTSSCSGCVVLDHRCRQLHAALRHHQICLETVQQRALGEGAALRARAAAAEAGAARLQSRLAAADVLVRDLYLENCQLLQLAPAPARL